MVVVCVLGDGLHSHWLDDGGQVGALGGLVPHAAAGLMVWVMGEEREEGRGSKPWCQPMAFMMIMMVVVDVMRVSGGGERGEKATAADEVIGGVVGYVGIGNG